MKTLELRFDNEDGKLSSLAIGDPMEPINAEQVADVMNTILANNVFTSPGGEYVAKRDARLVERNVEEIIFS